MFTERKNNIEKQALDYIQEIEAKEKKLKEEKEESYKERLRKLKERNENIHQHLDKVKEEIENEKKKSKKTPLFKKIEQNNKIKLAKDKEEYEQKIFEDKQKRKELFRPITKEVINEYKKDREEKFNDRKSELDKKRSDKHSEIASANENLPKQTTELAKKVIDEENENRKILEHQKEEQVVKHVKLKNFVTALKEIKPKVSSVKQKEMEKLREKAHTKVKRHHRVHKSVLFKKHDPNKPHKYKLVLSDDSVDLGKNRMKNSLPSLSHSLDESISSIDKKIRAIGNSPKSQKKIIPLKRKDYLKEMRLKKENDNQLIKVNSEANTARNNDDEINNSMYEKEAGNNY